MRTLLAGRYRIERPLGRGGMAVVQLAEDVELGRTVAVKLLADDAARDRSFHDRFLREARNAARLSHPNVVRVYDAGESDGRPYIVMEHVDGEPLDELLRREGPLAPERAARIAAQAAAGVAAAHAAGLVHRDVKPQNLLVRRDGTVKVADFGIARHDGGTRLTAAGAVAGTAAYLAPERIDGSDATTASDVYALGAVLYELLTGVPPRQAESLAELADAAEVPIAPVGDVAPGTPPQLERLVMRCLARLPEFRPASAAALAAELGAFLPESPTRPLPAPASAPEPEQQQPRTRGRTRLAAAVAVPALAAVAVALVVALTRGGGSRAPVPAAPPAVRPVRPSADPAQQARNLSAWLRANAARR